MQGTKPPHCPVSGCGVRSDRWTGKKDGYSLPSLDTFTLLLSPSVTIDTNTRICEKCYNVHRRPNADLHGRTRITPSPLPSHLLDLLAAATSAPAQPSILTSSPSSSTPPPPPLPPPQPRSPLPFSAPRPLSDITNTPRRQRRHSTPLERKRELAEAAAALDAAVHFSLSFALILLSCPHFSPSSLLIPFFYHLPPVVRRPHSAVSCSSAWEAPATWMQRKVSASCRAGASSRPCHLPPVIHCFKHGITLRSDRTYSCLRSLRHCNDLWLQLMTVSLCDGLIRRMHVGRERENSAHERGTAYFARPSRVSQLSLALGHVSLPLITYSSPLCLSMTRSEPGISTVLIGSFFVANTTTRHDYAESLQSRWNRTFSPKPSIRQVTDALSGTRLLFVFY